MKMKIYPWSFRYMSKSCTNAIIVVMVLRLSFVTGDDQMIRMSNLNSSKCHNARGGVLCIEKQEEPQETIGDETLSNAIYKVFERANSMRVYHLDLHNYRPEKKYAGDADWIDSRGQESKEVCSRHLRAYQRLLDHYRDINPQLDRILPDSIHLADTFGRPEAGISDGNQFWLGDYGLCKSFQHENSVNESSEMIKGQYCLGVTRFPDWSPHHTENAIKVGLCLPESCTTSILNENPLLMGRLQDMMKNFFPTNNPLSNIKLDRVYCLPHETSELRRLSISGKMFMGVVFSLVGLSVVCSIIDYFDILDGQNNRKKMMFIESFSIQRNIDRFFHIRADDEMSSIQSNGSMNPKTVEINQSKEYAFNKTVFFNSMAGIKCIGLIWIIAAHTSIMSPILTTGIKSVDAISQTYLSDIYQAAHLIVDTFFALMGIITSFMIFSEGIHRLKPKHWIMITLHRYLRLAPIYLLSYWFAKSLGSKANSGPLWDYATSDISPRVLCENESWLNAIFLMSDFKSPKKHCVPFAWFIGNSFKFWIVTPFILIPIANSIKRGYTILFAALLANMALVYHLASQTLVNVEAIINFKPEALDNMLNEMDQIYTRPYSRIGAYLLGLLMGHIFYMENNGQLKIQLSADVKRIIWAIFAFITLGLIFLLKTLRYLGLDEQGMRDSFSMGSALVRPAWAACSCWLMYAISHNQLPRLAKFLSSKFWRILVKVSFCAYLAQGEVIANVFLSTPFITRGNLYIDFISRPLLITTITCVISFFMVIFIEYPLNQLEKFVLPDKKAVLNELKVKDPIKDDNINEPEIDPAAKNHIFEKKHSSTHI